MSTFEVFPTAEIVAKALDKGVKAYLSTRAAAAFKVTAKLSVKGAEKRTTPHVIEPVFGDYATRNEEFKQALFDLGDIVSDYVGRNKVKRPLNILLAANPGSGKSFLVQQLADYVIHNSKVRFEEFHVAAFSSVDDLHGVFRRVQDTNLREEIPFILFDEVDGKVDGKPVFPNLLAPMWDGVFHVGRESFSLGKAVFVFAASTIFPSPTLKSLFPKTNEASTEIINYTEFAQKWIKEANEALEDDDNQKGLAETKARDFMDRIDIVTCIPPISPAFRNSNAYDELVDIACLLVRKHFKRVKRIEISALWVLVRKLTDTISRRTAEKSIYCSQTPPGVEFKYDMLRGSDLVKYSSEKGDPPGMGKFLSFSVKKPRKRRTTKRSA